MCSGPGAVCPRTCRRWCADCLLLRRVNGISEESPQRREPEPEVEGCLGAVLHGVVDGDSFEGSC